MTPRHWISIYSICKNWAESQSFTRPLRINHEKRYCSEPILDFLYENEEKRTTNLNTKYLSIVDPFAPGPPGSAHTAQPAFLSRDWILFDLAPPPPSLSPISVFDWFIHCSLESARTTSRICLTILRFIILKQHLLLVYRLYLYDLSNLLVHNKPVLFC